MSESKLTPRHVAIIMDGNGRWAQLRGKERYYGHMQGVEPVRAAVRAAIRRGVRYLTLYAFSTENWGRPAEEIDALMELFCRSVASETPELCKQGVRIAMIGDRSRFPAKVQEYLAQAERGDRRRRAADAHTGAQLLVAQRTGARRATARRPGRGRGIAGRSDRRTDRRQRALHGPPIPIPIW